MSATYQFIKQDYFRTLYKHQYKHMYFLNTYFQQNIHNTLLIFYSLLVIFKIFKSLKGRYFKKLFVNFRKKTKY